MGLLVKNVCFIGATCWLLYIWAAERMDDLFLAVHYFCNWFLMIGMDVRRATKNLEKPKVIVKNIKVSILQKKVLGLDYGNFFGVCIVVFYALISK